MKGTLALVITVVILVIIIAAVLFYPNLVKVSTISTSVPTSNLVVQLSDPPFVPSGSQALYITYNKVDILANVNGMNQWYNISQSGEVNLLSLINESSVIALASLPNDSQVKLVGLNVTGAKLEIDGTNQTVLIGEGFIASNITGNVSLSSLKNVILDFSPAISTIITADQNVFVLTPTVKAIITPPSAFVNITAAKIPPKLGFINRFTANFSKQIVSIFHPGAVITSASMVVNGNITSFNVTVKDVSNSSIRLNALMIWGNKTIYMPPLPHLNLPTPIPQIPHATFSMNPNMKLILPNGTQLTNKMLNLTNANLELVSGQNISINLNSTANYSEEQVYRIGNGYINNITINKSNGVATFKNIPLPNGTELIIDVPIYYSPNNLIPGLIHRAEGLAKNAPLFYFINSTGGISFPEFSIPSSSPGHHYPITVRPSIEKTIPIQKPQLLSIGKFNNILSNSNILGNISSILGNLSNSSSIISVINKSLSKLNITNISEELSNGMNISNIGRSVEHDVNSVLNISGISLVPSASWMRGYTLSPGQSVTISYTGKLYLDPNIPEINGVNYGRTFAVPIVGNLYEFVVLTQGGPVSYNVTASQ